MAKKKATKKVSKKPTGDIKSKVMALLKQGMGPTEAARQAGCSLTTARYHAKKLKESGVEPKEEQKETVAIVNDLPKAKGMELLDERIKELEQKLYNYKVCKSILATLEEAN